MNEQSTLLVTGCSRGIGAAITRQLLAQNHRVIGISRKTPDISSDHFTHLAVDLSDLRALPEKLNEITASHPTVDSLILNAGQGDFGALEQFSVLRIEQLINLNLTSQILITRKFLPAMKAKKSGNLIFIGSEAALAGGRNGAVYCATKFGLRGLVQSLQEECAASGVRVGIINPGMVNTSFFDELGFQPGDKPDQHLVAEDVAQAALMMLNARQGAVFQEINLQPQKKVIHFVK
ncbi:MAG: SDR family NAD(P)-dependent oxidoreductase [Pseudomonadota bacterium]